MSSSCATQVARPIRDRFNKTPIEAAHAARSRPQLLAAAPLLELLAELDVHLKALRELAPEGDLVRAVTAIRQRLADRIERAQDLSLFVSVATAALILGRTTSAVTYLCRRGLLHARKRGASWEIGRAELEAYRSQRVNEE